MTLPHSFFYEAVDLGQLYSDDINLFSPSLYKYNECTECYTFSMKFGDSDAIKTEEDFEILKGEFVKHFNEKHKNLIRNKKKPPKRKYKKI